MTAATHDPFGDPLYNRNRYGLEPIVGTTTSRLNEMVREVAGALREVNVPHVLVGGMALAVQGVARATRDIDFLVAEIDLESVDAALGKLGFEAEQRQPSFVRYVRRPIAGLPGLVERVDVLVARLALGRDLLERAQSSTVPWAEGLRIPVMTIEGLLVMKVLASVSDPIRIQDRADILSLIRLHRASIDRDWVTARLAPLGDSYRLAFESHWKEACDGGNRVEEGRDFGL